MIEVAEADADWPKLLDRAAAGEVVRVVRSGRPPVELHAVEERPPRIGRRTASASGRT